MNGGTYDGAGVACFYKDEDGDYRVTFQRRGGEYATAKQLSKHLSDILQNAAINDDDERETATKILECIRKVRCTDVCELVGGKPKNDQENSRECAFRECMEEYGIIDKADASVVYNQELYDMFARRFKSAKEVVIPTSASGKPIMLYVVTVDYDKDGNPFDWIDVTMTNSAKSPERRETSGLLYATPRSLFMFTKAFHELARQNFLDLEPKEQMKLAKTVCSEHPMKIHEWEELWVHIPLRAFNVFYLRAIAQQLFDFEIIFEISKQADPEKKDWTFTDETWNELYN